MSNHFQKTKVFSLLSAVLSFLFLSSSLSFGEITTIQSGSDPKGIGVNNSNNSVAIVNEKDNTISILDLANKTITQTISVGRKPVAVGINSTTGVAVISNSKDDTVSIVDLNSNSEVGSISVGKEPEGVAINELNNRAYITNSKSDDISVIDLSSNTLLTTIKVEEKPKSIGIWTAGNKAVVANKKSDNVSIVDLITNNVISVLSVGENPSGVSIDESAGRALVVCEKDNTVTAIDIATATLLNSFHVGKAPQGIATIQGTRTAVITDPKTDSISIVDTSLMQVVGRIGLAKNPSSIAILGNIAIITHEKKDLISIVDLISTPYITNVPVGKKPAGVAIDSKNNIAVIANEKSDSISIFNITTNTVEHTINVAKKPTAVAVNQTTGNAYVVSEKEDILSVIDLTTNTVTATIKTAKDPGSLAVNSAANMVIVVSEKEDKIELFELDNNTKISDIPVGSGPKGISIDPGLNLAVVANKKDNTVTLVDLISGSITQTINVGRNPTEVAISPTNHVAAIVNEKDDSVSIIDLISATVTATIQVGKEPKSLVINQRTNQAIVANEDSNDLFLIDLHTNTVLETINIGKKINKLAVNPKNNTAVLTDNNGDAITVINLSGQDATAPQISITSHQNNGIVSINPITISGTVDDQLAEIYLNGSKGNLLNNTFTFSGVNLSPGENSFTILADDPAGNINEVHITIILGSDLVANAGFDQTANESSNVMLDASGSSSSFNETLSYHWQQIAGSSVILSDSTSISPTFTAPLVGALGEILEFKLTVNNNFGGNDSDTVAITVKNINQPPIIEALPTLIVNEDNTINLILSASDIDGDPLSYQLDTPPTNGILTGSLPTFTYTPNSDFNGADNFSYTVSDGSGGAATATVNISVSPINDAPIANEQAVTTNEDTSIAIILTGSDIDGDSLVYMIVSSPSHGMLSGTAPDLTYTPDVNYNGTDLFTFTVNDGTEDSNPVTVNIAVTPVNDAPVTSDSSVTTDEDISVAIGLQASDIEGDSLIYTILEQPNHGTLSGTLPGITYAPSADYNGQDNFSYQVSDGEFSSSPGTVTIMVSPVNDQPVAVINAPTSGFTKNIIALDGSSSADRDGDTLDFQWSFNAKPAGSSIIIENSDQAGAAFTPDLPGTYQISLVVNDSQSPSVPAQTTINIQILQVTVPDLIGLDKSEAEAAILAVGLAIGVNIESHSDTVPIGHVISQAPSVQAVVNEDTPVNLNISLGSAHILPTISFSTFPSAIEKGESASLAWEVANADHISIDNGLGAVESTGTVSITPESTTTYTLTATNAQGTENMTITVPVSGHPAPLPIGSFGKQYEDLIPADAAIEEYNPEHFTLIRGEVTNVGGAPLADVAIKVHQESEYGTVFTDSLGQFTLPVEGGGRLTLIYTKDGYLTVHRQVAVPWNDIVTAETITMVSSDPVATTFSFNGQVDTITVHRSTPVTDEFGTRSATMVLSGDNMAYLVDEQGNDVQPLSTITTRATEYTTPGSMPAELPPSSAYTYCAELSVDGAERVRFEKPVAVWVENFLGFEVGVIVPVGYYDRDQGAWLPAENGVVVELLDQNGDGIVDSLDADGDGEADDLDQDGLFDDEVEGLTDQGTYTSGKSYWRAEVTHFTPWDFNWPFGPPLDAVAPTPTSPPYLADLQSHDQTSFCPLNQVNSYVSHQDQVYHEDISITGTDLTLHYASNRADDYLGHIVVPASGPDPLPASLKRIDVIVEVAGQFFEKSLPASPNQLAEFEWNWTDHLGNPIVGSVNAHVKIGFVYDQVYYTSSDQFKRAFAQTGNDVTNIRAREEMVNWQKHSILLNKAPSTIAEGWTLSNHHFMSPKDGSTLYKGDGSTSGNRQTILETMATVDSIKSGYGATNIAFDQAGNAIVMVDPSTIVKIDKNGEIQKIYPAYWTGYNSAWYLTSDIFVDRNNILYLVTDGPFYNCQGVFKVNLNNPTVDRTTQYRDNEWVATAFVVEESCKMWDNPAFTDETIYVPDLGPYMGGAAFDSAGNFYIADKNPRLLKVDPAGTVSTIAGTGVKGYSGDGGQATNAQLFSSYGVEVDHEGNIYFIDHHIYDGTRIRKIDTSGIITTVAGGGDRDPSGNNGYSADGGSATEAYLATPAAIALDKEGNLYIADSFNYVVRKVDKHGIIRTIAGDGTHGYSGDGGPAGLARLGRVWNIDVAEDGNIYVADADNLAIRKIWINPKRHGLGDDSIVYSESNGLSHTFSYAGLHLSSTDTDTGAVLRQFNYDEESGKLLAITDQFGNQISIEYNEDWIPTGIISPDGLRTELVVDKNNHLSEIIPPNGHPYYFQYTEGGLLKTEIEPEGNLFDHYYNLTGRLTDFLDQEGSHWSYKKTFDSDGISTMTVTSGEGNTLTYADEVGFGGEITSTITDGSGAQSSYARSADGLTVTESLSCGMEQTFQYDVDPTYGFTFARESTRSTPRGLSVQSSMNTYREDTDADGFFDMITNLVSVNNKTITQKNDIAASTTTLTLHSGRAITTQYDPTTLATKKISVPGLFDVNYVYDLQGRLKSNSTGERTVNYGYDTKGLLSHITDPEKITTFFSYDAEGRLSTIERPDGNSIGYIYDKNGNLTVLNTPTAIDHEFGYNGYNYQTTYTTPLSGTYQYQYDKDRRPDLIQYPSGIVVDYVYDKTQLDYIVTPEGVIDYTYLCSSKLGSIAKGGETVDFSYDGTLVTSVAQQGTLNQSFSMTYNNNFSLSSIAYADKNQGFSYDDDGMLTTAGLFIISRNPENGLPDSITDSKFLETRGFNGYGELETKTSTVNITDIADWSLTRDKTGRIIAKTETFSGISANYEYGYDQLGGLQAVTKDGILVEEYNYDANGNRVFEMNSLRGITGRSFAHSEGDHIITAGDVNYVFDVDGFLLSKEDGVNKTLYSYSSQGKLLRVTLPNGTIDYQYDPLGRRITKIIDGQITEKYLWLDLTTLLAVYDGSDNLLMRFEYADSRMPIKMTKEGEEYYLTYDQVGSLRAVADSAGNVIKLLSYDSFGSIVTDTNTGFTIPFGFAGGLHDLDTGLVLFGHRDYDPEIGSWVAKDPIKFAGGDTNLYRYVQNDPVNFVDPLGLRETTILDFAPGLEIPFQIYDFNKKINQQFAEKYNETKNLHWKKIQADYTWIDAMKDMYKYDVDEAIEHYTPKYKEPPEIRNRCQ